MTNNISALSYLLAQCHARGIRLVANDDGDLIADAPQGVLDADLLEQLKARKADLIAHMQPRCWHARRNTAQRVAEKPVCRCGSTTSVDVLIHQGRSTRRDCARCGRFIDFSRWYGRDDLQADE